MKIINPKVSHLGIPVIGFAIPIDSALNLLDIEDQVSSLIEIYSEDPPENEKLRDGMFLLGQMLAVIDYYNKAPDDFSVPSFFTHIDIKNIAIALIEVIDIQIEVGIEQDMEASEYSYVVGRRSLEILEQFSKVLFNLNKDKSLSIKSKALLKKFEDAIENSEYDYSEFEGE